MVLYFAYGSNMDEDRMKERIKDYKIIGKGILKGYKLVFNKPASKGNGEGYANVTPKQGSVVEGIVYEIDEKAIEKLDIREGVPNHYKREKIKIFINNKVFCCEIYIASKTQEDLKPTREYLAYLLRGEKFISKEYLNLLKSILTLD